MHNGYKQYLADDIDFVIEFIDSLDSRFSEINKLNKRAIIEDKPENRDFLEKLKKLDYISSYTIEDKGLRINHKRS